MRPNSNENNINNNDSNNNAQNDRQPEEGTLAEEIINNNHRMESNRNMMIYTKLAGRAVIRVVDRCNQAKDSNNLDLSNCQLMQVPDAVYHLMRHTTLRQCNLSGNDITKLSPKFATKFTRLTTLNLAHNQLANLPDEMGNTLHELKHLDISHNTFVTLPKCCFTLDSLQYLNASHNHIVDFDVDDFDTTRKQLDIVDLTHNPLNIKLYELLAAIKTIRINLSPREREDWEDLSI